MRDAFVQVGGALGDHRNGALLGVNASRSIWCECITVNPVAPALTETPITLRSVGMEELARRSANYPLGRLPQVEEIAYAVAWPAKDEAAMITGRVISPNGDVASVGI